MRMVAAVDFWLRKNPASIFQRASVRLPHWEWKERELFPDAILKWP